jgi:hypothetical protein
MCSAWLVADVNSAKESGDVPIHINADANIYAAELDGSTPLTFQVCF